MKSWKTTLSGVATILMAVSGMVNAGRKVPDISDLGLIFAGIGTIAAKDSNVTGGTKRQ